jgi:hypothetical protein
MMVLEGVERGGLRGQIKKIVDAVGWVFLIGIVPAMFYCDNRFVSGITNCFVALSCGATMYCRRDQRISLIVISGMIFCFGLRTLWKYFLGM